MSSLDIRRIDFERTKYGNELLVDLGRLESLPGYILSDQPHRLTFYEIVFLTGGSGRFFLDFAAHPIAPGRIFFTSPGQVRRWRVESPVSGVSLFFTAGFVTEFFNDPLFLQKLQFFHNPRREPTLRPAPRDFQRLREQLEEMESEIRSLQRDSVHLLRALLYGLLIRLNRMYGAAHGLEPDTEASSLMHRFRRLIEERFREDHGVRPYAERLFVTPGHLSDLARRHSGVSAGELIRARLVVEAKRLILHSDRSLAQIATELGFQDPSYFARFFRRHVGCSPRAFRADVLEKYQNSPAP